MPQINKIKPDLILVSAGFDAGINDPLGKCGVLPSGFGEIVSDLQKIQSKVAVVLEGGYNLETISESMSKCAEALLNI